ncbi:MAG: prolyl oligopeptidase family serine peptidase [Pseudomonadota bacterium]
MFKKILLSLLLVVFIVGVGVYGWIQGWHLSRQSSDALERMLAPHYEVFVPDGTPPFATVVGYHGCSGTLLGARDWANVFKEAGYAVVLVESMTPRDVHWRDVCAGKILWGNERAGDVMVSLDAVRRLPFVDPNRLHLIGWSHGGWSLMDAFYYAGKQQRPPNLRDALPAPLEGVLSATFFYPFCEFPSVGRHGWPQSFPTHFIFADRDSIVSNAACERVIDRQRAQQRPVSATTYVDTDHAFDMRDEDFYDGTLGNQPDATRQVRADMLLNLRRWTPESD